jgi:hypothetical protein
LLEGTFNQRNTRKIDAFGDFDLENKQDTQNIRWGDKGKEEERLMGLIKGLEGILRLFLEMGEDEDFEDLPQYDEEDVEDQRDDGNPLIKILTFGFLSNINLRGKEDEIEGVERIVKGILVNMRNTLHVLFLSWKSNPLLNKVTNIFNYGLEKYDFQRYSEINRNLTKILEANNEGYEVRQNLTRVFKSLYNSYQTIFLDSFIEIWYMECKFKVYPPDLRRSERLLNIIDIFLNVGVSIEDFISYLPRSQRMKKIREHYTSVQKNKDFQTLNQEIADTEARLLFMVYALGSLVYLNYIEDTTKRRNFLTNLWNKILAFLR